MIVWRETLEDVPREGAVAAVSDLRIASLEARGPNARFGPRASRLALAPTPRDLAEAPMREPLRSSFLARRALTRRFVAARLEISAHDVVIGHAPGGAPIVIAPVCGLYLSTSGRDGFCAIGLADHPIGVDIEPIAAAEPIWNVLHPREQETLRFLSGASQHEAFLRLWTAKEAYLKALGLGLSHEPANIAVDEDGLERFAIRDDGSTSNFRGEWRRMIAANMSCITACALLR